VEVTVDDAGPGINPLERAKVFERFYRGSASGRRGAGTGTGLGLALVAEHMHVMRGDVRVETSPEGGARLVLTLPVASRDDAPDGEEGEDGAGGVGVGVGGRMAEPEGDGAPSEGAGANKEGVDADADADAGGVTGVNT
jgi:hypothetical protein